MALLALVAFVFRARAMRDGIYGDELFTLRETRGHDLLGVIDEVAHGAPGQDRLEDNPPLFFLLARISEAFGDPTALVRLPSAVAGAAAVPVVYLLGLRTVGRTAALAGAAFMALSPFAIFYGNEARPYALLTLLAALTTLMLLIALERRRTGWWVAYGVSIGVLLYTHYTGAVVIGVQGAWALWFHRDAWRPLLISFAAVAVAYLPWLPYVDGEPANFGFLAKFLQVDYSDALLQWLVGVPEFQPEDMPGLIPLVLMGAGLAVGLAGHLLDGRPSVRARPLLIFLLAVTAPLACLVYGLVGPDLFLFPRNLSASLPFVGLALGAILVPRRRLVAGVALALAGVGLAIASVKSLDRQYRRPDFRAVAAQLDRRAGTRDLSVYYGRGLAAVVLLDGVRLYTDRSHDFAGADLAPGSLARTLAARGRAAPRAFVLGVDDAFQVPPSVAGWEQIALRSYAGHPRLVLVTYARLGDGGEASASELRDAAGRVIPVVDGQATGYLEAASPTDEGFTLSGWAATPDDRPVDRILAFADGRLAAAGIPAVDRSAVAAVIGGSSARLGFRLQIPSGVVNAGRTEVALYAVAGGKATRLLCTDAVTQVDGC